MPVFDLLKASIAMWVFDLTYFLRSQRSKLKILPLSGIFPYCLTERAVGVGIYLGTHYIYSKFQSDLTPNLAIGGIVIKCKSTISEVLMIAIESQTSLYVYLMRLHQMYTHLFSLTFHGHRGQSQKIEPGPLSP